MNVFCRPFRHVFLAASVSAGASAQVRDPGRIVTTGNGEVALAPDWATIALTVLAEDSSAFAAASAATATTQQVTAALAALGLSGDSTVRVSFSVQPRYDWTEGQRLAGYLGLATVHVVIGRLDQLASIIDTALAAGATGISGLRFRSYREEEARVEALRQAVAQARADAEVLAAAAGGTLGRPREIDTERPFVPSGGLADFTAYAAAPEAAAPDLTPQDVIIRVVVETDWELVIDP